MKARAKKWLLNLVKFAVCGVALWYLSTQVTINDRVMLASEPGRVWSVVKESGTGGDRTFEIRAKDTGETRHVELADLAGDTPERKIERGLKSVLGRMNWRWAVAALIVFAPVTFVLAWRLRLLLDTQEIPIGYRDALLLTFAGNFFNFTLPGTTGGDLYKAYHIAKRTHKRMEGVTLVLLDRVFGLVSFLILAVFTIFVARNTSVIGEFGQYVGWVMLAVIGGGLLYFSERFRQLIRFDEIVRRLPLADKLQRIDATAYNLRRHKGETLTAIVITVISHFGVVTCIYFLARGFGIDPQPGRGAGQLYIAVLISTVVGYLFAAIPISFQGFGLFEAVFIKVLVKGGWCDISAMLVLTLSARLVQVLWSLPGVVVPWLGLERPSEDEGKELEGNSSAISTETVKSTIKSSLEPVKSQ